MGETCRGHGVRFGCVCVWGKTRINDKAIKRTAGWRGQAGDGEAGDENSSLTSKFSSRGSLGEKDL